MFVISLGGSIVVPDNPDSDLIRAYRTIFQDHIDSTGDRMIVIVGGGATARKYQAAFREAGGDSATGTPRTGSALWRPASMRN